MAEKVTIINISDFMLLPLSALQTCPYFPYVISDTFPFSSLDICSVYVFFSVINTIVTIFTASP